MHENIWLTALQIAAAVTNLLAVIVIGAVGFRLWRNGGSSARTDVRLSFYEEFVSLDKRLRSGVVDAKDAQEALAGLIGRAGILFGDDVEALLRDYGTHAINYSRNAEGDLFSDKAVDPKVAQRRRAVAGKGMDDACERIVRLISAR